jgi:hypothetical protein
MMLDRLRYSRGLSLDDAGSAGEMMRMQSR